MPLVEQNRPGVYTARDWEAVSPSNTVGFTKGTCTCIYVGGAGIVVAVNPKDESTTAFTCTAGGYLSVGTKRVHSTGTTATLMVALY